MDKQVVGEVLHAVGTVLGVVLMVVGAAVIFVGVAGCGALPDVESRQGLGFDCSVTYGPLEEPKQCDISTP